VRTKSKYLTARLSEEFWW